MELWLKAVDQTRTRSPASFEQWFSSIQFDCLENGVLQLTARDEFVRDWVKTHFLPDLVGNLNVLLETREPGIRVEWRISSEVKNPVCESKPRVSKSSRPASAPPAATSAQPGAFRREARSAP